MSAYTSFTRALGALLATLALAAITTLGYGCSGYSSDEATQRCDFEQQDRGQFFDDQSYTSCISCYEDCGDDCAAANSSPERYTCPQ